MGIEWFRDLSIIILACVTIIFLIFGAIIIFRLYRQSKDTLISLKDTIHSINNTVLMVQESMKPVLSLMGIIASVKTGFEFVKNIMRKKDDIKERAEGGQENE